MHTYIKNRYMWVIPLSLRKVNKKKMHFEFIFSVVLINITFGYINYTLKYSQNSKKLKKWKFVLV